MVTIKVMKNTVENRIASVSPSDRRSVFNNLFGKFSL